MNIVNIKLVLSNLLSHKISKTLTLFINSLTRYSVHQLLRRNCNALLARSEREYRTRRLKQRCGTDN